MPKIAIFGGSFNPPGTHHRLVVEALIPHFDKIIILPCGPRPDKPTTNDVDPWHRGALTDIAFRGLDKVEVDLSDLECAQFTTNDKFADRYGHLGEIWHVIGSDLSAGGSTGQSAIHRYWELGAEMWNTLNFCVVARAGYSVTEADVPPRGMLVQLDSPSSGTSAGIRERIFKRQPYAEFVTPEVLAYIERYGLYRGRIPARRTNWQIGTPRILLVTDTRNPKTAGLAEQLRTWEDTELRGGAWGGWHDALGDPGTLAAPCAFSRDQPRAPRLSPKRTGHAASGKNGGNGLHRPPDAHALCRNGGTGRHPRQPSCVQ